MMEEALRVLNEREKEALRLLANGHDAKSVARHLGLSVHTVNERLRSARRKLGLTSSRAAARRLAVAERSDRPKILGYKDFGEDAPTESVTEVAPSQSRRGPGSGRWIIGGLLVMLSLAVAALIFTQAAVAPAPPIVSPTGQAATVPAATVAAARPGEEAALIWVGLVDRQQWADSWSTAGSFFKAQVTEADWASTVRSVRESVGPLVSRTQSSTTPATILPGLPVGDYQIIQYRTAFRDKPASVETVTLAREGETWRVIGYFIR